MANITERMTAAQYLQMTAGKKRAASSTAASGAATSSGADAPTGKEPQAGASQPRRNKFGNRRTGNFDSVKEARIYEQLVQMMSAADPANRVISIKHHVRFEIIPKQEGERATYYEADFVVQYADGRTEVIDVKSAITRKHPVYVIKRKQMLFVHGIRIVEM